LSFIFWKVEKPEGCKGMRDTDMNMELNLETNTETSFSEIAMRQAALETDCPLLARPLYLYRVSYNLSAETLAQWLGLGLVENLNRLAMCLAPRSGMLHSSWDEAFVELTNQFPGLRITRLQLVVAATAPTRTLLA